MRGREIKSERYIKAMIHKIIIETGKIRTEIVKMFIERLYGQTQQSDSFMEEMYTKPEKLWLHPP